MESSGIDVNYRFNENKNCESNLLSSDQSELDNPVEFRICTSLLNSEEVILHTKNETAQARHGENVTQSKSLKTKFTGNKSRSFNEKSNKQSRRNVDNEKTYVPKKRDSPGPSKNIDNEKIYGHKQRNLSRSSRNVDHQNIYDQKQRNLHETGRNVEHEKEKNEKQKNTNRSLKNDQGNQNVSKTSTFRRMDYKYLQELFKEEISDSIIVLANTKFGFLTLFDRKLKPDWLILIMAILSKVCSSDLIHLRLSILSEACNHVFLDELQKYIATISTETDKTRQTQIKSFFNNTFVFCNTLYEVIPNTAKERLKKLLYTVCIVLNYFRENECKILEEQILVNLISSFSQLNPRTPNLKEEEVNIEKSQECPPDDFRCINILPTYDDMFSENPFLRRNIVKGSYSDIQSYLDIQFRLFREDFIAPLRDGIHEYITVLMNPGKKNRMKSIKTYYNVHFISCASKKNGFGFDVDFNAEYLKNIKWQNSKRFMFGSLLLISNDDFKTFFTVTVLEREIESLKKGIVTVAFPYGAEIPDNIFDNSYVMLESVVYFEPYFRVLTALQAVTEDNFPMEKYIISVESEIDIPKYLKDSSEDNVMEEDWDKSTHLPLYDSNSEAEDHEESVKPTIRQTEVMNKKYSVHQWIINKFKVDNILDKQCWPSQDDLKLDPSQYSAFKAALTSEFCVIQGPPGTGKTFIALKIAEALLKNVKFKSNPIMIICYTNHALDQFLEGILSFTDNLIRIGGQSKNEKLEKYNLKHLRQTKEEDEPGRQIRYLSRNLRLILEEIAENISLLERKYKSLNYYGILKMGILQTFMSLEEQRKLGGGILGEWLLEDVLMGESIHYTCKNDDNDDTVYIYQAKMEKNEKEDVKREELLTNDEIDIDEENSLRQQEAEVDPLNVNFQINLNTTWKSQFISFECRQMQQINNQLQHLNWLCSDIEENTTMSKKEKDKKLYFLSCDIQKLKSAKCKKEARLNIVYNYLVEKLSSTADFDPNILKEFKQIKNIWALDINKRWALYNYWKTKYGYILMNNIKILEKKYRKYCFMLDECRQVEDLAFVKNAKVIGMTTTSSARLHSMVQKLKPKIVIVEEAAEVFEAHIVTALAKDSEHVILIGDHKQLRPSPNVFKLAKDYNLDISLFERMINNGMSCHTLAVQHRMRPEFASLIVPTIYPKLQNHPSVEGRPDIKGVASNMYFIKHTIPEDQVEDSSSRCNKYEADFLISLCCYLIYQGYKPEEITMLAPYTGQMYYMFKKRKENPMMKDVRITVVDNFQGEENKIILLCLVRSNAEARIGFLGTSNRVCVSLSRAKEGFYIIGNMENLTQSSGMWNDINMQLEKLNAIGPALPLRCEHHKHHITRVSCDLDFSQVHQGCCSLDCGFKMNCGHICTKMCHLNDREHVENKCLEYCMRKKCEFEEHNYKCDKLCWEECLLCVTIVNHNLACGHEIVLPCHEIENYKCTEEVEQLLMCGHSKIIKCHLDPSEENCEKVVERKFKCGHDKLLKCCVNVDTYECEKLIQHELSCGHSAMIPCCQDPKKFNCKTLEKYTLPLCEHEVDKPCYMKEVEQSQCPYPCNDRLECGHSCGNNCHKHKDPDHILYECTKACTRKKKNCSMDHGCDKLCNEECDKCDIKVIKELPCGHEREVLCSTDVEFVHCNMPCDKILKCSHSVNVECSTDLTLLICNEKSMKKLPCGHTAFVKCSENIKFIDCMEVVEKTVPICGHKQQTTCYEEPQPCQEIIHKDDVQTDCGHANIALPCSIYQKFITPSQYQYNITSKIYSDVIPISNPLSKKVKSYCLKQFCQEPCNKQLSCGHTCVGLCGSCLQGNIHVPCSEFCNKVLVCGHKCNALCKEICPPCNQNCLNTCQHGDCGRKCGETCKPCTKKCDWECPHKRCTRLCSQMCDCDPCNEPCPKKLKCQHPCMGFCGEVCPPLCWSCDNLQSKYKENERLVQLEDCEHIVESWKLESAINTSIKEQQIVLKVCPICASPINKTKRYRNNTRITYRMIQAVKKEVLHEFRNMYNKIDFLKQKLSFTSYIEILQPVGELVNNILNESKPSKEPHEYYSVVMISEWLIELGFFFANINKCENENERNERENVLEVKELIENRIVALLKSMQFYLHGLNFEVMNRIGLEIVRIKKMINLLIKHNRILSIDESFDILFSNCDYTLQVHTIICDKLKERDKHLKIVPSANKNVNLSANMWYHCLDDHVYSVLPSCGKICSKCNIPRKMKTRGINESIVKFHRDQYNAERENDWSINRFKRDRYNADTGRDVNMNRFQRDRYNGERENNKRFPIGRRDEGLQFYTRNDNVRGTNYREDQRVKDKTFIGSLNMTGVEHRHSKEGSYQHRLNCMQSVMRREIVPPNYKAQKSGPFVTEREHQQHLRSHSVPIHKEMSGTQRTPGLQIPQNKIPSLLNIKFKKPPIQPEVSSSVVTDNQHQSIRRQHVNQKQKSTKKGTWKINKE